MAGGLEQVRGPEHPYSLTFESRAARRTSRPLPLVAWILAPADDPGAGRSGRLAALLSTASWVY